MPVLVGEGLVVGETGGVGVTEDKGEDDGEGGDEVKGVGVVVGFTFGAIGVGVALFICAAWVGKLGA